MSSWRDHVSVHPAADLFPTLGDAELRELADDIKRHGLREKIKIVKRYHYRLGGVVQVVIDGRNRLDALELVGESIFRCGKAGTKLDPDIIEVRADLETDAAIADYIISVNVRRRYLTGEQKRELFGKLLKTNPERSNLQTAKIVGVDDKTVASVRGKMEARSEIPDVAETVDTKGRRQPTHKAVRGRKPPTVTASGLGKLQRPEKLWPTLASLKGLANVLITVEPEIIAAHFSPDQACELRQFAEWLDRLFAIIGAQATVKRQQAKAEALV